VLLAAGVGEPVPAVPARAGDEESGAEGSAGAEEGSGSGGEGGGGNKPAAAGGGERGEGAGGGGGAPGEKGGGGGGAGAGGVKVRMVKASSQSVVRRRLGATSIIAGESLHEYPHAAADRGRVASFPG